MDCIVVLSSTAHLIHLEKSWRDENNLCVVHKEVGGAWLCVVLRGYTYAQFSFKQMCVAYSAQFEFEFVTRFRDQTIVDLVTGSSPDICLLMQNSRVKLRSLCYGPVLIYLQVLA